MRGGEKRRERRRELGMRHEDTEEGSKGEVYLEYEMNKRKAS
jgi:hypothetical protein